MLFSIENILGMSSKDKTSDEHTAPCSNSSVAKSNAVKINKELGVRQLVCPGRKRSSSECSADRYNDEDRSADEADSPLREGENRSTVAIPHQRIRFLCLLAVGKPNVHAARGPYVWCGCGCLAAYAIK